MRKVLFILFLLLGSLNAGAQMYTGVEGLLHAPSADMSTNKSLRVGAHYLNMNFVPKYSTIDPMNVPSLYISLTPYKWIEASYMVTCWKSSNGLVQPDRSISLKVRPLEEGKWWPSVVLGTQDPIGTNVYTNFYASAAKHFDWAFLGGELGTHLSYRYYKNKDYSKWGGLVGGLTYRPNFYRDLRFVAEYDGCEVNMGVDATLFDFLKLQLILQNFKWLSGGICFEIRKL